MKENDLIEIIKISVSKNDILLKYYGYSNKWSYNKLNNFIIEKKIDVSHLENKTNYCLNCNNIIKKRNKFCNSSCAATFNNKKRILSEETKNKIGNTLKGKCSKIRLLSDIKRTCVVCSNEFIVKRILNNRLSKSNCCSTKCNSFLKGTNTQTIMKKRINEGIHKGWSTRNIISYPEKFFMNVLDNNNVKYKHNYPVNKKDLGLNDSHNYFLDFYLDIRYLLLPLWQILSCGVTVAQKFLELSAKVRILAGQQIFNNMDAESLLKGFRGIMNVDDFKTSPIMYDPVDMQKRVSINALKKDENGIWKNFHITIEETIPPSDPETYIKKSGLYNNFFNS